MNQNNILFLRHATLVLQLGKLKILVDPMLSDKDALDPVQNCENNLRIPMVDLPIDKTGMSAVLKEVDAVAVTHLHRDHWDSAAQQWIDKDKLIFCQPDDAEKIRMQGFRNVQPIDQCFIWNGITINRTNGQHGTGEIGKKMGAVSGFVFTLNNQSYYIAGDTIWCDEVAAALGKFNPGTIVLNAGAAQFLTGDPITMSAADIIRVHEKMPASKIIAVHMDTVNHCLLKRTGLKKALEQRGVDSGVIIPADGERIMI